MQFTEFFSPFAFRSNVAESGYYRNNKREIFRSKTANHAKCCTVYTQHYFAANVAATVKKKTKPTSASVETRRQGTKVMNGLKVI